MVFFGQFREPELDCGSAPLLALRDEGTGAAHLAGDDEKDGENDELSVAILHITNWCRTQQDETFEYVQRLAKQKEMKLQNDNEKPSNTQQKPNN